MRLLLLAASLCAAAPAPKPASNNRIASVLVSQDLINQLLRRHSKSKLVQDLAVDLDPDQGAIVFSGLAKVPIEELKAINLDKGLDEFRFQVALELKTTKEGHLILLFPLNETYFWPASSKDPAKDRVIVPVQLLSIALGSARGYLAALSGDFSGFDRKAAALKREISILDQEIPKVKDADESQELKNQRKSDQLQLEAIPIERQQIQQLGKTLDKLLGFTGEKELNLNQELGAHRNALILRLKLSQLLPYLEGVELSGVRVLREHRYGTGEKYLAIDVDAQLAKHDAEAKPAAPKGPPADRRPDVVIRLHQSLFESEAALAAESKDLGGKVRDLDLQFKDDGLHARGKWVIPMFPDLPFMAVVDFVWTGPNVFEMRVRKIKLEHISVGLLAGVVLDTAMSRLNRALKGACAFDYLGKEDDGSRAVRVTMDMAKLMPSFPDLVLTNIETEDRRLILKAARR